MCRLTLVALLGSSGHGALDRLGGLVDGVPNRQLVSQQSRQHPSRKRGWKRGKWGRLHLIASIVCVWFFKVKRYVV